jgi:Uma2 family endonuclease
LTPPQPATNITSNSTPAEAFETIMAEPASREATYDDLLRVPPPLVAEILHGQLHTHPRPAPRHAIASSALGGALFDPFGRGAGGPGGWWILDEPEIHLGRHVIVPDIAGWRRQRMPALPDTAWFALAPDWVCEVLSPATAQTDRSIKLPLYAEQGVGHCWLVDPLLRTLEAYALSDGRWLLLATLKEAEPVRLPPFDAIEFALDALWA